MILSWLVVDGLAFCLVGFLAWLLIKRAADHTSRHMLAMLIVASYAAGTLLVFSYCFYRTGYTLYGSLLFGALLAGVHFIPFASLVSLMVIHIN
jgi:hypothetical protein